MAAGAGQALAQAQPAVVVSLASVDETIADVTYITEAAGVPQVAGLVQFMSAQYTQAMDKTKPAGLMVSFNGPAPTVIGFLPVSNLQGLLNLAAQQVGPAQDVGNGIKQINGPQPVFLKEGSGFVYLSNAQESLGTVPGDPVAQLGGLEKKYNVAVAVNVKAIPQQLRQMAVQQIQQGYQQALEAIPDEEQRQLQMSLSQNSMKQMEQLFNEGEQILFGLAIDAAAKSTYLDISFTATAGTPLAQQLAQAAGQTTNFAGFNIPQAAAVMTFSSKMADAEKAQAKSMLGTLRTKAMEELDKDEDLPSDEARQAAKEVLAGAMDVLDKTVDEGIFDGGAVLNLNSGTLQFAMGMHVADGVALQNTFKKLMELAKDDPEVPEVKFNAAKLADVSFHTMAVPVPDQDAQRVLGETAELVLGTGAKTAYFAFGKGSMDLLQQVINDSAKKPNQETVPVQLIVSMTPIMNFASQFEEGADVAKAMLAAAGQAQGKDHVMIRAQAIRNGFTYRIEVEEGVVRMIGAGVASQMQQQQGGN